MIMEHASLVPNAYDLALCICNPLPFLGIKMYFNPKCWMWGVSWCFRWTISIAHKGWGWEKEPVTILKHASLVQHYCGSTEIFVCVQERNHTHTKPCFFLFFFSWGGSFVFVFFCVWVLLACLFVCLCVSICPYLVVQETSEITIIFYKHILFTFEVSYSSHNIIPSFRINELKRSLCCQYLFQSDLRNYKYLIR